LKIFIFSSASQASQGARIIEFFFYFVFLYLSSTTMPRAIEERLEARMGGTSTIGFGASSSTAAHEQKRSIIQPILLNPGVSAASDATTTATATTTTTTTAAVPGASATAATVSRPVVLVEPSSTCVVESSLSQKASIDTEFNNIDDLQSMSDTIGMEPSPRFFIDLKTNGPMINGKPLLRKFEDSYLRKRKSTSVLLTEAEKNSKKRKSDALSSSAVTATSDTPGNADGDLPALGSDEEDVGQSDDDDDDDGDGDGDESMDDDGDYYDVNDAFVDDSDLIDTLHGVAEPQLDGFVSFAGDDFDVQQRKSKKSKNSRSGRNGKSESSGRSGSGAGRPRKPAVAPEKLDEHMSALVEKLRAKTATVDLSGTRIPTALNPMLAQIQIAADECGLSAGAKKTLQNELHTMLGFSIFSISKKMTKMANLSRRDTASEKCEQQLERLQRQVTHSIRTHKKSGSPDSQYVIPWDRLQPTMLEIFDYNKTSITCHNLTAPADARGKSTFDKRLPRKEYARLYKRVRAMWPKTLAPDTHDIRAYMKGKAGNAAKTTSGSTTSKSSSNVAKKSKSKPKPKSKSKSKSKNSTNTIVLDSPATANSSGMAYNANTSTGGDTKTAGADVLDVDMNDPELDDTARLPEMGMYFGELPSNPWLEVHFKGEQATNE
jgi:hypothetical protein